MAARPLRTIHLASSFTVVWNRRKLDFPSGLVHSTSYAPTHRKVLDRASRRPGCAMGSSLVAGQEFAAGAGPIDFSPDDGAAGRGGDGGSGLLRGSLA
jgi:hypothetical protein